MVYRNDVINLFTDNKMVLDSATLEFIMSNKDPVKISKYIITFYSEKKIFRISMNLINVLFSNSNTTKKSVVTIKKISDQSTESKTKNSANLFRDYFINRFKKTKNLLSLKQSMSGATSIAKAFKRDGEVSIIGMIYDIKESRSENNKEATYVIELEDDTGFIRGYVNKSIIEKNPVTLDEVIGVIGHINPQKKYITINNIIQPDIPRNMEKKKGNRDVSIAFISDLHVGSKNFLRDKWNDLSSFLGTEHRINNEDIRIESLFVVGDLVDGIGVYPGQEDDIDIVDIMKQYEELSYLLKKLPSNINIYILPGNHDIVRAIEPQPELPDNLKELFSENVIFLSNPSYITYDGVNILLYHGRTFDDLVGSLPKMTYSTPTFGMNYMLKTRSLVPVYGGKTPISPEYETWDFIETLPDIFATGHIHYHEIASAYNISLINSSTWQSQTAYQRMHNFSPMPCILTVVNLATRSIYSEQV